MSSTDKITVVQIAKGYDPDGNETTEYLDTKGRVWYQESVPDEDKCEYDERGRRTKSVWKSVWKQLNLPNEPGA